MPPSVTVGVTCTHVTLVLRMLVNSIFDYQASLGCWLYVTLQAVTCNVVEVVKRVDLVCHVTQSNSLEIVQCEVHSAQ